MTNLIMLGCGGHARVLVAALELQGIAPTGCLSPTAPDARWPSSIPYLGGDDELAKLDPADVALINGLGSIGSTAKRQQIYEALAAREFSFAPVIHPSALVAKGAILGDGVQVMAGAIVQSGADIGPNVLLNTGAIIDHDCLLQAHCHVATGARLSGDVRLGTGVHVGTGAAIIQGISIGEHALIGAGAVVVHDIPARVTVVGNPARQLEKRSAS